MAVQTTADQLAIDDHITGIAGQRTSGVLLVAQRPAQRGELVDLVVREQCSVGYLQPTPLQVPASLVLTVRR
jgi:hypothetical protein